MSRSRQAQALTTLEPPLLGLPPISDFSFALLPLRSVPLVPPVQKDRPLDQRLKEQHWLLAEHPLPVAQPQHPLEDYLPVDIPQHCWRTTFWRHFYGFRWCTPPFPWTRSAILALG